MGFLDHSTNNIIVDAVLTDIGRQKLRDGNFQVVNFAFGDDEVDYGLVPRYGRVVGKEKIEKNTPVFEAQTRSNLGLKYQLINFSNPLLKKLPIMSMTPAEGNALVFTNADPTPARFIAQVTKAASVTTQDYSGMLGSNVEIEVNTRFFNAPAGLSGQSLGNGITRFVVPYSNDNAAGDVLKSVNIPLTVRSLSVDMFNLYGDPNQGGTRNQITGFIRARDRVSGLSTSLAYTINMTQ